LGCEAPAAALGRGLPILALWLLPLALWLILLWLLLLRLLLLWLLLLWLPPLAGGLFLACRPLLRLGHGHLYIEERWEACHLPGLLEDRREVKLARRVHLRLNLKNIFQAQLRKQCDTAIDRNSEFRLASDWAAPTLHTRTTSYVVGLSIRKRLELLLVRVLRDPEARPSIPTCLEQGQRLVPRHQVWPLWPSHRFACAMSIINIAMGTNMNRAH
jgi:hypothetical protein